MHSPSELNPTRDPTAPDCAWGSGIDSLSSHPVSHLLHGRGRSGRTETHGIARVRTGWMVVGVLPRLRSPVRVRSSAPQSPGQSTFLAGLVLRQKSGHPILCRSRVKPAPRKARFRVHCRWVHEGSLRSWDREYAAAATTSGDLGAVHERDDPHDERPSGDDSGWGAACCRQPNKRGREVG